MFELFMVFCFFVFLPVSFPVHLLPENVSFGSRILTIDMSGLGAPSDMKNVFSYFGTSSS